MVNFKIDGRLAEAKEGTTILSAARQMGIEIPTLCYFEKLNEVGACRVCVVEVKGEKRLLSACNTAVRDGMEIYTASERVREARRVNVELILSNHDCHCPTCGRNGSCVLQKLAEELNIGELPYREKLNRKDSIKNYPLQKNSAKCIGCLRCVNVCDKIQSIGVWALVGSGAHAKVTVRGGLTLDEAGCSLCGQCITHCPVGALTARDDTQKAFKALSGGKTTVIQIAPAVRAAWGEDLGLSAEMATPKRMAAAAKALGADYVFDTNFTADLTIMEEGSELLQRLANRGRSRLPLFTSCCPGWVRFVKMHYPQLCENLSTAKSPQQMFGSITKSWFAEKIGVDKNDIFCISVMPCTAKKYECDVPQLNDAADKDVDLVLTTREFVRMLRENHINASALDETDFDSPMGTASGAGVIFGATGGVLEAALRSAYYLVMGENPDADAFTAVRAGENGAIREITANLNGTVLKAAVTSGLGNARKLCEQAVKGESPYDFIEIMACPGGCAGGGGQPITEGVECAAERGKILYALDKANTLRFSHENPEVQTLYREYLEKPLGEKSHKLLHTEQKDWSL